MPNLIFTADSRLSEFSKDIVAWHGYVSFLGLPSLQPNADVGIDELYVPHYVSRRRISSAEHPGTWDVQDPVNLLRESQRIVVLGDPGSGKSTLVSWLAWYLASGFAQRFPGELDGLLPLPIVLRDLPSGNFTDLDSLLDAFCSLPVAANLNRKVLREYFSAGRCLFLVDGLDEIPKSTGNEIQSILNRDAGRNYCLVTSRIVGFSRDHDGVPPVSISTKADPQLEKTSKEVVCYIAPFSDEQIAKFSANWYREQSGQVTQYLSRDFVEAINSDEAIKSLARTPNLLTMMAQIFRVRARLPNGRALLYDDIAQAYLESIDTARKMKDEFSWKTKRRWLAKIAFEMQMMRSIGDRPLPASDKELLVDREDVLRWLNEAIVETDGIGDENYASRYLDWIARRSGLLLPRGEGKYAFLHLSFQEYFAARYIKSQVEHPRWPAVSDVRVSKKTLRKWFDSYGWSQIFVFVFELFSGSPGWAENLIRIIFPDLSREAGHNRMKRRKRVTPSDKLLADLLINPHAAIPEGLRDDCMEHLVAIVVLEQVAASEALVRSFSAPDLERLLLVRFLESPLTQSKALDWLSGLQGDLKHLALDNLGSDALAKVEPILRNSDSLRFLSLSSVPLRDCSVLSQMSDLEALSLSGTPISSIDSLQACSELRVIFLDGTGIKEANVLKGMKNLTMIDLDGTAITNIDFVSELGNVKSLSICNTNVHCLAPLSRLVGLTHIAASETFISDVAPLRMSSGSLRYLDISGTDVACVDIIGGSKELISCFIDRTKIENIDFISGSCNLKTLWMDRCDVSDVTPLASCRSLHSLRMSETKVQDVSPLARARGLEWIIMDKTPVRDLSPLAKLKKLRFVSIVGCDVDSFGALDRSRVYEREAQDRR